ncbi:hypothetical protein [Adhaeretor mobilis]|uniref:Uncharacterized protein n=1 Tax=Adhaeretor mobilis TaxID=1930276 RepID=A0A517MSU3_9BACT|nr:hypothetical protein [Adhaeretor mobilis]QDS97867.1 hypothetical protein HG15A2_11350 [Adhaeretor mobilis]
MTITSSSTSYTSQSSSAQSRPQGPPPQQGKQQLSNALQSISVDESTTTDVLSQIDEAISALESESSSGSASRESVQSAIDNVLEANGIDTAEVGKAIQASGTGRSGGPSGAGRPNGPPPPPKEEEESSTLESALLSAGVDESSTDELVSQILESLQELNSDESSDATSDDFQSLLSSILEENGASPQAFEQVLASRFDAVGLFVDRLA